MLVSHIITAVLSTTSVTLALSKADATLETKNIAANTTCWAGHIHGPCYGHDNGCTPDGIYVSFILPCRSFTYLASFLSPCPNSFPSLFSLLG